MHRLVYICALSIIGAACGEKDDGGDDTASAAEGGGADGGGDGTGDGGGDGGNGGGDGGNGGGDNGGDDGPAPFVPAPGHWAFSGGQLLSDSCQYDEDLPGSEPGVGFTLSAVSAAGFELLLDGDTSPYVCTLTERAFTCAPNGGSADVPDVSDATLVSNVGLAGSFPTDTTWEAQFDIGIDCSGGDCGLVEFFSGVDFPCAVAFTATASPG